LPSDRRYEESSVRFIHARIVAPFTEKRA
jgi:hypothetical protein